MIIGIILAGMMLFSLGCMETETDASTYYVSVHGDNKNDGNSKTTSFRTIRKGVEKARPGDTIVVKPGHYGSENILITRSGTSEDNRITIKAEIPGTVILEGSSPNCLTTDSCTGAGFRLERVNYITIEGFMIKHYQTGIRVNFGGTHIFRKNIFQNNSGQGIQIWKSHNNLVELSQFLDPNPPGRIVRDAIQDYGVNFYYSNNGKVLNNYFYGNHNQAVSFKKGDHGGYVTGNTFEGCLYTCVYLGQNDSDPYSSNLIVQNNVFRPAAPPYRLKSPVHVRNVRKAIIRNNFMEGMNEPSGQGIMVWRMARDVTIYNNVIINSRRLALRLKGTAKFFHNTIVNTRGITSGTFGINNYIKRNYNFAINSAGFVGPFADIVWPSAPNPRLIPDFSRANSFRLQGNSPLINTGKVVRGAGSDFNGNSRPQGLGYDIGAFEFGSP